MQNRKAVMPSAETSVTWFETGSCEKVSRSYTATASGTVTAKPRRSPHEGDSQKVEKPTAVRMICGKMTFIMYRLF